MKHMLLTSLAGLLMAGCANQSGPYSVSRFYPIAGCSPVAEDENISIGNGYLDVAAGEPQFLVGVEVLGLVVQNSVELSDGVLVEQGTRRAFIREQFTTYELSKRVGSDPEEYIQRRTIPLIGESQFAVQLISPELGQALFDNLSPANDLSDVVDIDVTVEFRGEYADDRQPFSTGSLVFPIRAFKSSPPVDCINGYERYPPQFDADGNPIPACLYVGQGYGQFAPPPPPSVCVP